MRLYAACICLLIPALTMAQTPAKHEIKESDYRMAFSPWMLLADRASHSDMNGNTYSGIAPGLQVSYIETWGMGEGEPGTFDGGGYMRTLIGFGRLKSEQNGTIYKKNWLPFDLSIGAFGSYVFPNAAHEIGFDYGFLGIYGYSVYAYFGAQFTLMYRYKFLQVDLTRGGAGVFRGPVSPKFNSPSTHSATLTVHLPKNLVTGLRFARIPQGSSSKYAASELRIFFGLNFSSKML